ncbi:MAG: sugar ABC transporter permease [Bacilli bacterium]|nr:sugar ABC transporter permease [Bacilli bacterium]
MGIELFSFIKGRRKGPKHHGRVFAEPEKVPEYTPGIQEDGKIIRLVNNKKLKKPYRVTGIDDVASKNNWKAWLYLAPVIILVVIFLLYPLINTIFISVTKNYNYTTGKYDGFTLENFGVILHMIPYQSDNGPAWETSFTTNAIPNTFILTFITVPVSIALALLISVLLNSIKAFQKFLQTVFFLPYVTNAIAIGMVFSVIFDDKGLINYIFGTNTHWIYNTPTATAMVPLCLFIVWNSIPFKILILLSGLQGIDKQYYQAAQIDAAPKWKTFGRITVPLLSPQILYLMITSFIGAFKEYNSIVAIFGKRGETLAGQKNMYTVVFYVYDNISSNTSFAAAAAVFLFLIILVFTFIQFWASNKRVYY